jgi:hypothetical protein
VVLVPKVIELSAKVVLSENTQISRNKCPRKDREVFREKVAFRSKRVIFTQGRVKICHGAKTEKSFGLQVVWYNRSGQLEWQDVMWEYRQRHTTP